MKRKHLLASLAVLGLAACGGGTDTATTENAASDDVAIEDINATAADTNLATAAPLPSTPQEFADMAAGSDQFEIQSSELAQQKAQDAAVKEFAAMLVKDHTKSTADLKTAAGQASPAITPAPALNPEQQANLDALRVASGADFDRLYLQQQVPAHEAALSMLQGYAAAGDVQPLKEFASKTAPVVQQHLEHARSLQR